MEEHPYSNHLNGRDPLGILAETSPALHTLLDGLSSEEIDHSPGPSKWSLREIMAHLADCEISWSWRIRQTLASPGITLQPFDQDLWGERYAAYPFADAQRTFDALRAWNLRLLSTLTPADLARSAEHAERGTTELRTTLATIAGHDLHHLRLLEGLIKRDSKETIPSPS